jgi:hypothetical protein
MKVGFQPCFGRMDRLRNGCVPADRGSVQNHGIVRYP